MQEDRVLLSENSHCPMNLFERAHARRQNYGPSRRSDSLEKPRVREPCRGDLVARDAEPLEKVDAFLVPGRREPGDAPVTTVHVDLLVFVLSEFEATLEVAVSVPERALSGSGEFG